MDEGTTELDLSDCGDILMGRWLTEENVKRLLPENGDEIDDIKPLTFTERWPKAGNPALANKGNMRLFEQWWYKTTDFIPMVVPRVSIPNLFEKGKEIPLKSFAGKLYQGDEKLAKYKIKEVKRPDGSPAFSRYSKPVDRTKLRIFVDGELVWDGNNPLRSRGYNYIWYRGEYCAEYPRSELKLQSFVRRLRDPQRAFNRRYNQIMDIIESTIQSYRIVRDRHIMNPEEAYKSGQGVVMHATDKCPDTMPLKELFYQGSGTDIPSGLFTALETADKSETEAGGLNNEIFGSDDKDIPGILSRHRTGQALTGQMPLMDSSNHSDKILGKKIVELVQLNYNPEKVARLINEQPAPGFYKQDFVKYDCSLVEGLLTSSQQEAFWFELKEIRRDFPDAVQLLPLSVVAKYCPTVWKSSLVQLIRQGEQQMAQQAQKQQQADERSQKMQDALTESELAQSEERRTQAQENLTGAALDKAQTMAKIQELKDRPLRERAKLALEVEKMKIARKVAERKTVNAK